jgi:uncharacterized membrane protein YhaH (DUF805 family)
MNSMLKEREGSMQWYIAVLKKYAEFSGRARRQEYWMFFLFNVLIAFAMGFVLGLIGGILGIGTALSDPAAVIYSLGVLLPSIAVGVRRMHDIGRSGWWIIVPFVNLVFLCLDSQPGSNEYGPNPKMA